MFKKFKEQREFDKITIKLIKESQDYALITNSGVISYGNCNVILDYLPDWIAGLIEDCVTEEELRRAVEKGIAMTKLEEK